MRNEKIDIKESKIQCRVIIKESSIRKIEDQLIYLMLVLPFPFFAGFYLVAEIQKFYSDNIFLATILFLVSVTYSVLLIYSLINNQNLVNVEGESQEANRVLINKIAVDKEWKILNKSEKLDVFTPKWKAWSSNWGRRIVIIYDKKNILINCIAIGLHDLKSPFHWFSNRALEKKIISEFKNRKKHAT